MAAEDDSRKNDVVTTELSAPAGWTKKIIPKKGGTVQRSDVFFISPTGEEIKSKRQLDQYLKSHPGGPTASEFDWAAGDTPRRSARLSEKSKAVETSAIQSSPTKKQKRSATKRGAANEKSNASNAEGEAIADKDDAADEGPKENPDTEIPGTKDPLEGEPAIANLTAYPEQTNEGEAAIADLTLPEKPGEGEPVVTDPPISEQPNVEKKAAETDLPADDTRSSVKVNLPTDDAHSNLTKSTPADDIRSSVKVNLPTDDAHSNLVTNTDAESKDSKNMIDLEEAKETETAPTTQNHESEHAAHADKETPVETREKQVDNNKDWLFQEPAGTGN